MEKEKERVLKCLYGESTSRFYIHHRYEILISWPTLRFEVLKLCLLGNVRTIEMIRSNFQSVAVGEVYVLLVFAVNTASTFCGFKIYISHFRSTDGLPKHVALIVTQVNTVDVTACVFAFHIVLSM